MSYSSGTIVPAYSVSEDVYRTVNDIAGAVFDNNIISLSFNGGVTKYTSSSHALIKCQLKTAYLEATLYVDKSEVERLTGFEFCYMDEKYLSYLMSQHLLKYGLYFESINVGGRELEESLLAKASLTLDHIKMDVMVEIDSLLVDNAMLMHRHAQLPGTLSFNTSLSLLETVLDSNEILSLSTEDVILVYPK